jgi:ribonuclease I
MIKSESMMRRLAALLALGLAPPAAGQDFDYYVLALSWSPSWCAT